MYKNCGGSEDIFDYNIEEFIVEDCGCFAWGETCDQKGVFNVEFTIIENNEDMCETIVKIDEISII